MGSCNFKSDPTDTTVSLSKNHFSFHHCIGKGGFGRVWKVELKKQKENFAMKEMSKARILTKKSVNSVINERRLLSILKHPFLVNMKFAFQDRENLYLVMDYMPGGDLRHYLGRKKRFDESQSKFMIACILSALDYLHNNGILHRDVKPENLVFDSKGYLHLTDFGIARVWNPENAKDTSGTPGYMAPEVMCHEKHGVAVDYFAVGVISYELMFGKRPYSGRERKEIRDEILAKQVEITREDIPEGWSLEAADFINRLIERKPVHRLGLKGPKEIKNHPWFDGFDWEGLLSKEEVAPFVPRESEEGVDMRVHLSNDPWNDANTEAFEQNLLLLNQNEVEAQFAGYFFDIYQQDTK